MEWRIHASQILLLIYSKLIPLNKLKLLSIKLQKNKEDLTENELIAFPLDLSDCIQVLPENAARPADYWFIPNKYWEIESVEENSITIKATSLNRIVSSDPKSKKILFLPKSAFVPSMSRTMKKYALCPPIIPVDLISDYYLDDENYPNQDIKNYKKWGESAHKLHYFSESHSHFTAVKNDLGIITKIDFTNTKTLALRFLNPVMGTSVFRMGFSGINEIFSDLLFSYITCSLFLLDALEKSRTRRAEFVRINLIDVYLIYRFPNLNDIIKRQKVVEKILSASKQWNNIPLKQRDRTPDLILNLRRDKNHPLRRLDEAWFEALDIPISLIDIMYQEIEERLRDITAKKTRAITSEEEEDDD